MRSRVEGANIPTLVDDWDEAVLLLEEYVMPTSMLIWLGL